MDDVPIWGRGLVGGAVDQLKQHFGMDALADWLMGKLLKNLAFYYDADRKILGRNDQRGVAAQVLRGELREALLAEKDKEIMLIAHSMGSIIAYDALRDLGREAPGEVAVKELVTIGSPLGLPHVMQKIREERQHYDARAYAPPPLLRAPGLTTRTARTPSPPIPIWPTTTRRTTRVWA